MYVDLLISGKGTSLYFQPVEVSAPSYFCIQFAGDGTFVALDSFILCHQMSASPEVCLDAASGTDPHVPLQPPGAHEDLCRLHIA